MNEDILKVMYQDKGLGILITFFDVSSTGLTGMQNSITHLLEYNSDGKG